MLLNSLVIKSSFSLRQFTQKVHPNRCFHKVGRRCSAISALMLLLVLFATLTQTSDARLPIKLRHSEMGDQDSKSFFLNLPKEDNEISLLHVASRRWQYESECWIEAELSMCFEDTDISPDSVLFHIDRSMAFRSLYLTQMQRMRHAYITSPPTISPEANDQTREFLCDAYSRVIACSTDRCARRLCSSVLLKECPGIVCTIEESRNSSVIIWLYGLIIAGIVMINVFSIFCTNAEASSFVVNSRTKGS